MTIESIKAALRSGVPTEAGCHHPIWSDVEKADATMAAAADLLEAQQKRIAELEEAQTPFAAMTTDCTGCEHMSRDVANIEAIAAAGSEGSTEVVYLYAAPAPQQHLLAWQPIATADKNQERLTLGIFRSGKLEEIHVGGYRYAYNDDEESCWWSDQCDDEIVPTHWMPDLADAAALASEGQTRCRDCDGYNCDDGCAYPDPTPQTTERPE